VLHIATFLTIFVIAGAPWVHAQTPAPAKVTKADAQRVLKIISGDKVKTRVYCEMGRLGDQMEQADQKGDSKEFDDLFERIYELGKKLGPEYAALIVDSRTSIRHPKSVSRLVRLSTPSIICVGGNAAIWTLKSTSAMCST